MRRHTVPEPHCGRTTVGVPENTDEGKQKTAGHENLRLKAKQRRRHRIGAPCYTWNQKSDSWANAVQKLRRWMGVSPWARIASIWPSDP